MTGVRSVAEAKDFSSSLCVQTSSEAHQASYPVGTGVLSGGKARPGRDADHLPHLVPRSRMSRIYTHLTHGACMTWRDSFILPLINLTNNTFGCKFAKLLNAIMLLTLIIAWHRPIWRYMYKHVFTKRGRIIHVSVRVDHGQKTRSQDPGNKTAWAWVLLLISMSCGG
jgi:hypothetical protein